MPALRTYVYSPPVVRWVTAARGSASRRPRCLHPVCECAFDLEQVPGMRGSRHADRSRWSPRLGRPLGLDPRRHRFRPSPQGGDPRRPRRRRWRPNPVHAPGHGVNPLRAQRTDTDALELRGADRSSLGGRRRGRRPELVLWEECNSLRLRCTGLLRDGILIAGSDDGEQADQSRSYRSVSVAMGPRVKPPVPSGAPHPAACGNSETPCIRTGWLAPRPRTATRRRVPRAMPRGQSTATPRS